MPRNNEAKPTIMRDDDDDWFERERLHRAAGDGDLEAVGRLLDEGRDPNAFDSLSYTPLHHAAEHGHVEIMRMLLARGADPNARDVARIGDTALASVAATCSLEVARILVEAGADPTVPGWMNTTALDRAARRKRPEGVAVHACLQQAAARRGRP
tara:strand:+ start:2646 stop:3110 length:465 start_codon:yes stop_codon:yes gene_type:complete